MMPKWQKLQKGNPCKMRYHNITKDDMLNGDGLRAVLWVAGCTHKCKGCHNPVTWDIEGGIPFDEAAKEELKPEVFIQYQGNEAIVADVIEKAKNEFVADGHRASSIKSLQVYLKPEEFAAYYVINQKFAGRVDLF